MRVFLRLARRACAVLLILPLLGLAFLIWQVDRVGQQDQARPSDAIIVLGARVEADGSPGSDLTSRTYHAVDLWRAGQAPYIICTGGYQGDALSAAAVCKRFAVELGVPASLVFVADGSANTLEDAQVAARLMAGQGWRTALLVSHPLHLFRAAWLFRRAGVEVLTSPTSTDTGRIFPPLRLWYATREAAAVIITALHGWNIIPPEWVAKLQTWASVVQ